MFVNTKLLNQSALMRTFTSPLQSIRNVLPFSLFIGLMLLTFSMSAQKSYTYDTIQGDALKTRIYTFSNGLKVYMSVMDEAPRIYTAIAVRTGSKNDPVDNTGMSHYLEHMMFKGTSTYGTADFADESIELEKIENLFEEYRSTTDEAKRKAIYHRIDSVSAIAAKYAIANEYDKLLTTIGAKGTNAFTGADQTVYINDIPSNQFDNWLIIERDRFTKPVFRIFHTELETVYEEKNMSLDRDGSKAWESLYAGLYKKHTYGTQTTLGSVEHLKNPSLKALKEYFTQRYAPNNMAIVLAGDFNPDSIIVKIEKEFGTIPNGKVADWTVVQEQPLTKPEIKEVIGPDAENVLVGFRLGGANSSEVDMLRLLTEMLSNGKAGLMDLNINLAQKAMNAGAYADINSDYSSLVLYASPKTGQSLDEVKELLLSQLQLIKDGDFPEWLLDAAVNNLKLSHMKEMEKSSSRALLLVDNFINNAPYANLVNQFDRISFLDIEDIKKFARIVLAGNYVAVYKKTGTPEEVAKVEKPQISPVDLNRTAESDFLVNIRNSKPAPIEPKFVDFKKDISVLNVNPQLKLYSVQNTTNQLFELQFRFDMGSQSDLKLGMAIQYLPFLGTHTMSPEQLKQEFFKLACDYDFTVTDREISINLSGLSQNMEAALILLENLLTNPKPDQKKLDNMVEDLLKARADAKLSKRAILGAMIQYANYGPKSAFTNVLSENELKNLKADELCNIIKGLTAYKHEVLYYGDKPAADVVALVKKNHKVPANLKPLIPATKYNMLDVNENQVFLVDYEMKQVDLAFTSKSSVYNVAEAPQVSLFNEYFGNIVFQDIREARALAYTAYASYNQPRYSGENNSVFGYVGTQNDKMPEAMKSMINLFNNMPEATNAFLGDKNGLLSKLRSERTPKSSILKQFMSYRRLGVDYDLRKDIFSKVSTMEFKDIKSFSEKNLKNKKFRICVLGKSEQLNKEVLQQYGKITPLKLEEIFGY